MQQIIQRMPFLLELFINGSFILLYSLKAASKIPSSWSAENIELALEAGAWFVPIVLFFSVIVNYINCESFEEFLRKYIFSLVVFIPLVIAWGDQQFAFWLASAHLLSSILILYDVDNEATRKKRSERKKFNFKIDLKSAQVILISFAGLILLGTFFLKLPFSAAEGKTLSLLDAIFMSTSATCVTGLATVSLADNFSLFGQIVMLALIQIGGLGIMILFTSLTILLGRSMRMRDRVIMQDMLDLTTLEGLYSMIIDIIKYTFIIELWGGIILTIGFSLEDFDLGKAIYYGFFHSISAFCNAGFSLFNTSLESYATNPIIHGTIAILITLGGFGFIVLKELKESIHKRRSFVRTSLHTKIVLVLSFVLTSAGFIIVFFGEYLHALDNYTLWEKIQISLFQSVTLRTAGFNTVPLSNLNTYTLYSMCLFMFIGASPGSTGGGIKTTTLAIIFQTIVSTLKGLKRVTIFGRQIPSQTVVRVTALTFISIFITSCFILIMMKLEPDQSFLTVFFEVVSASGTVGLSLGITPFLSGMGKLALSLLMFIGRIGPLTLVLAIGEKRGQTQGVKFPEGRILIG